MKIRALTPRVLAVAALCSSSFLLPGCGMGPTENADASFASFASQEVSNMGADAGSVMAGNGAAKMSAAAADTLTINYEFHRYTYDAAVQGFVRIDTLTTSGGYERIRRDTITFFDATGAKLANPTLGTVDHFEHVRTATHTRGGNEADIHFDMTTQLTRGIDTFMVKNGSLTGTYNGDAVASGAVTKVTRYYHNGWQFPDSGSILVDFPKWKYEVEFTGSGNATATITNKAKDKVTVVNVHVDER